MSTPDPIRAAIKTTLAAVASSGVVHEYARYAKNQKAMVAFYQDNSAGANGPVRGWHIRRVSRRQSAPGVGRLIVTTRWEIEGYRSVEDGDASEQAFDELIEAVILAFDADDKLGGAIDTAITREAAGMQLETNEYVMFGGVLCHRARLALITRHYN